RLTHPTGLEPRPSRAFEGRVRQVTGAGIDPAVSCPLSGFRNLLELTTRDPLFTHDRSSRPLGPGGGDEPDGAARAAPATRGPGPIDEAVRRDHPGDRGIVRDAPDPRRHIHDGQPDGRGEAPRG